MKSWFKLLVRLSLWYDNWSWRAACWLVDQERQALRELSSNKPLRNNRSVTDHDKGV